MPGLSRMVDPDCLPLPVKVIGAGSNLKAYFFPPCDASGARPVDYQFVPGTTHLAQLAKPRECVRLALDFLRPGGFSPC